MTVSTTSSRIPHVGDGTSVSFAVPFPFLASGDIKVYVNSVLATSGYSVYGAGGQAGTVVFTSAPAAGASVVLVRQTDLLQQTKLPLNGPFPSTSVEKMADKNTLQIQQLNDQVNRAFRIPDGDPITTVDVLPSASVRAGKLLGFDSNGLPAAVVPADQSASSLALQYLSAIGTSLIGYLQRGVGAIARTLESRLQETIFVTDFGAFGAIGAVNVATINKAILAAYKRKANYFPNFDTTYSVTVVFPPGQDIAVTSGILWPSGINIDLNGSRLVGPNGSSGGSAFSGSAAVIDTAVWDDITDSLVSNAGSSTLTKRLVGSQLRNGAIINALCAVRATNLHETSGIWDMRIGNCARAFDLHSCYYSRVERFVIRSCATLDGEAAVQMSGLDFSQFKIQGVIVGASRALRVDCPTSAFVHVDLSLEEAYISQGSSVDGIGIQFNSGYLVAWDVGGYFEGVRVAIGFGTANMLAPKFRPSHFSNCEYAIKSIPNGIRAGSWESAPPDDGGVIRNLVDLSPSNNECTVRINSKQNKTSDGGISAFPTNFLLSYAGRADAISLWMANDDSGAIATSLPAIANAGGFQQFAFEGSHISTRPNETPFMVYTATAGNLIFDTNMTFDISNLLMYAFEIVDVNGTYKLYGNIFGADVIPATGFNSKAIVVTNNAGKVRVTVNSINTGSTVAITRAVCRHA